MKLVKIDCDNFRVELNDSNLNTKMKYNLSVIYTKPNQVRVHNKDDIIRENEKDLPTTFAFQVNYTNCSYSDYHHIQLEKIYESKWCVISDPFKISLMMCVHRDANLQ